MTIATFPRDSLIHTFQTNTFGPLEVAQTFLPYLRRAGTSRVVNISSGYGQLGGLSNDAPSYSLSKMALNGITIMLADALHADGVAVNSVCPGWVRTDMGGPSATRSVQEGADTAAWLADEASHKLTGKFFRDRHEILWWTFRLIKIRLEPTNNDFHK
jgi:NAD(P)-dependent dehydrogenase (short-subunit alcohol dehydrogenase family)